MTNLEDKLKATVLAAQLQENKAHEARVARKVAAWMVPAVAAACLALFIAFPSQPKDTFEDPALAYAELEKTFALISEKIDKGASIAMKAEEPIETIKTVFE